MNLNERKIEDISDKTQVVCDELAHIQVSELRLDASCKKNLEENTLAQLGES